MGDMDLKFCHNFLLYYCDKNKSDNKNYSMYDFF